MQVQAQPKKSDWSVSLLSDQAARDAARAGNVALAQSVIGGARATPAEMYRLAEQLKDNNEFGYAWKLFWRIRRQGDYGSLTVSPGKVGQRQALCTYKDPDLPASDRFARALRILNDVDRLGLTPDERQESLGLRGAVYKRMWQWEGQQADLERSLGYYLAGYEMGPERDQGYTGINAAFVLDLLAKQDATQARRAGTKWMVADERCRHARTIRERLATLLPQLADQPEGAWMTKKWWYYTTVAEAHVGLGDFDAALAQLRKYNVAMDLPHPHVPSGTVAPWELESAITQLTSLGELQADLAELLGGRPDSQLQWPLPPAELRQRSREAFREYLGDLAPGVERAVTGKLGLALSGGGFRASLFHIGVLAYLSERDVLRHVEALSCVSGGSIIGAQYYLEVQRLLETKADEEITREDYVEVVQRLEQAFLRGVERNIRCRVYASIRANLRSFLQPGYTTTRRLGELYERELYSQVRDGKGGRPRYLPDLFVRPKNEGPDFKPKYDNWRRMAKVPILVLNATTLNSGHNWQFTASWMGEPPSRQDREIEANYRLRRMYYGEAPRLRDKWRHWYAQPFAPPNYQHMRLGDAVAASSCVPGLFEPLVLPDLYDGKTVRLVDGGVYDNQGMASLLEQDCTVMIVSDATGQMGALDHPSGSRIGVPLRAFSVSMARVRSAQYRDLISRSRSGLLKGMMFLHLTKGLSADPVNWRECPNPYDPRDDDREDDGPTVMTGAGLGKDVQRLLSAIRTDLDSFTEVEAFALMTSGYHQARTSFDHLPPFPDAAAPEGGWRFLRIDPLLQPGPGYDDLLSQLGTASMMAGKVWRLSLPLTVLGIVLAVASLAGLGWAWRHFAGTTLLTVGGLGASLVVLAATAAAPHIVQFLRFRRTIRNIGLRSLLMAILAVGFKLHLRLFDRFFLRLGRLERLRKMREAGTHDAH